MDSKGSAKIMAKVTKKMLKSVVKECLVEILSEGLGDAEPLTESRSRKTKKAKSIFDQMDESFERKPRGVDHVSFDARAQQAAEAATSDPLLQSILADTAKTTLQQQLSHEPRSGMMSQPGPQAYSPQESSLSSPSAGLDINSLFGEATRNWGEVLERSERKPL
jgi:hypothetical protein